MKTATAILLSVCVSLSLALPACAAPGVKLYVPYAPYSVVSRTWFTLGELYEAMNWFGYDPGVWSIHTWCELHPDDLGRRELFRACYLNVDEEAGGNTVIAFWFDPSVGEVVASSVKDGER